MRISSILFPFLALACSSSAGGDGSGGSSAGGNSHAQGGSTGGNAAGPTTSAGGAGGTGGLGEMGGGGSTSSSSGGGDPGVGTGLEFPPNLMPGSDARLVWSGASMLPRTSHTAIWKAKFVQQNGYYAVAWHTSNDGTWHASNFEFGTHPYPTTGTLNADGQSTGGTGSDGAIHYYEIAGLGASDFIASPGPGPTYLVAKDVWVTQARTCEVVGGNTVRHRYWPDIGNATDYIEQSIPKSSYDAALSGTVSPAFTIGGSPWTGDGVSNNESPAAVLRGFAFFDAPLSIADIAAEAASDSDAAVTAAGAQSVWYINKNPTPTDVSDKSGAGNSPTWANDQRPNLYQKL